MRAVAAALLFAGLTACAAPASSGRAFCAELRGRARFASSLSRAVLVGAGASAIAAAPETTPELRISVAVSSAVLAAIGAGLAEYASDARDEREQFCSPRGSVTSTVAHR